MDALHIVIRLVVLRAPIDAIASVCRADGLVLFWEHLARECLGRCDSSDEAHHSLRELPASKTQYIRYIQRTFLISIHTHTARERDDDQCTACRHLRTDILTCRRTSSPPQNMVIFLTY